MKQPARTRREENLPLPCGNLLENDETLLSYLRRILRLYPTHPKKKIVGLAAEATSYTAHLKMLPAVLPATKFATKRRH